MIDQIQKSWQLYNTPQKNDSVLEFREPSRFGHSRIRPRCAGLTHDYQQRLEQFHQHNQAKELHRRATDLIDAYGSVMLRDLDYETALNGFRDTLRLAPNHAKCHNNMAVFYWEHGEHQKAVEHLRKALDIDPDDRETVWNCGQVMTIIGEPLLTRHTYLRFMNRNGHDEEMASAIAGR